MLATVARDDDVAVLQPNTGVVSRSEIRITPVTGEPNERPRECEAVALCDASGAPNVPFCAVLVTVAGGIPREFVEPLDALDCNRHVCRVALPPFIFHRSRENGPTVPADSTEMVGLPTVERPSQDL